MEWYVSRIDRTGWGLYLAGRITRAEFRGQEEVKGTCDVVAIEKTQNTRPIGDGLMEIMDRETHCRSEL